MTSQILPLQNLGTRWTISLLPPVDASMWPAGPRCNFNESILRRRRGMEDYTQNLSNSELAYFIFHMR